MMRYRPNVWPGANWPAGAARPSDAAAGEVIADDELMGPDAIVGVLTALADDGSPEAATVCEAAAEGVVRLSAGVTPVIVSPSGAIGMVGERLHYDADRHAKQEIGTRFPPRFGDPTSTILVRVAPKKAGTRVPADRRPASKDCGSLTKRLRVLWVCAALEFAALSGTPIRGRHLDASPRRL